MPPDPPKVSCSAAKLPLATIVYYSQSTIVTVPTSWPYYFSARSGPGHDYYYYYYYCVEPQKRVLHTDMCSF